MSKDIDDLIARLESWLADWPYKDGAYNMISASAAALREQRGNMARLISDLHAEQERTHRYLERAERAEAERDAAMKDAERIDWLDKNPREATIRIGGDMKACVFYGVSCDPKWSAREAIDAAIAKGKGKGKG